MDEHFSKQEDWSPSDICPICCGKRAGAAEDLDKMLTDSLPQSEINDAVGGDEGERATTTASLPIYNSSSRGSGKVVSSNEAAIADNHMPPANGHLAQAFSHLLHPPMFPTMPHFLSFSEMANQFYIHNLLQWGASGMIHPSYFDSPQVMPGVIPTLGRPSTRNRYLSAVKAGTLLQSQDSFDVIPPFSSQYLAIANAVNKAQQPVNTACPMLPPRSYESNINSFAGQQTGASSISSGSVSNIANVFERKEVSNAETNLVDEQPLDLSSKRALQAATQSAASSVLKLREGKRHRATPLPIASDTKPQEESLLPAVQDAEKDRSTPSVCMSSVTTLTVTVNSKRNYSQADLDAAVKDIRCGRLGTRRASVVYGIPRSTLRNKIYKLEAAEELSGEPSQYKRRRATGQSSTSKSEATVEQKKAAPCMNLKTDTTLTSVDDSPRTHDVAIRSRPPSIAAVNSPTGNATNWEHGCDSPATSEWNRAVWSPFARHQTNEGNGAVIEEKKNSQSPANNTESHSDWKRSRPKRGQYRKYDKDALDEAVKSVRRGEMSVHRAGSFYGVPHSTLEYKVKERNLLRTKNRQKSLDDNSSEFGGSDNGQTVRSSRSSTPAHSTSPTPADSMGSVRPPTAIVQS